MADITDNLGLFLIKYQVGKIAMFIADYLSDFVGCIYTDSHCLIIRRKLCI